MGRGAGTSHLLLPCGVTAARVALDHLVYVRIVLGQLMNRDYVQQIIVEASQHHTLNGHLSGKKICMMFNEPSTRTKLSFEMAARECGAEVYDIGDASSKLKGESDIETVKTLEAMGFDAVILRDKSNYLLQDLRQSVDIPIVDAGQGTMSHPTQALADVFTILCNTNHHISSIKIAVLGDIQHSRVVRSLSEVLWTHENSITAFSSADLAAEWNPDVFYCLRPQTERGYEYESMSYINRYAVTQKMMDETGAYLMHPGPHIGVEFDLDLLSHPRCLIRQQVTNGVPARKAVLVDAIHGSMAERSIAPVC